MALSMTRKAVASRAAPARVQVRMELSLPDSVLPIGNSH